MRKKESGDFFTRRSRKEEYIIKQAQWRRERKEGAGGGWRLRVSGFYEIGAGVKAVPIKTIGSDEAFSSI